MQPDAPALLWDAHRAAQIVAFRNILIHGYATVDDEIVCDAATARLQGLVEVLEDRLGEARDGHREADR